MSDEILLSAATTVGVLAGVVLLVAWTQPAAWRRLWRGETLSASLQQDLTAQRVATGEHQRELERQSSELERLTADLQTQERVAEALHGELASLRKELSALAPLVTSVVTGIEVQHLRLLRKGDKVVYRNHQGVRDELRSLLGRGFMRKTQPGSIHELPGEFELTEHFELTEPGQSLLTMRERLEIEDALTDAEPRGNA